MANQIFDLVSRGLHSGSEFLMAINNDRPTVMAIKLFNLAVSVGQNIYQVIYSSAAIYNTIQMIQNMGAIVNWSFRFCNIVNKGDGNYATIYVHWQWQ